MTASHATTQITEPLLGSAEVATLLGMSREQVWRFWTAGRLPGYRFDRHLRFARVDIEHFMAQNYNGPNAARHGASADGTASLPSNNGKGGRAIRFQPI